MPNFALQDDVFEKAARLFPTPFHLYSEEGIRTRLRNLKAAFSWCDDFEEYFAVKALPNPSILRVIQEEGCGLDCSSMTELMLAKALGFSGHHIMFSANAMPDDELTCARSLGAQVNLDDISHIEILRTHGGIPECICCRYNPGGEFSIGNFVMGNPGDAKFGFTESQLEEGLMQLKTLGSTSFGLHSFLSSNTIDSSYYPLLADILLNLGIRLSRKTGLAFAFINLSGGIGIPYQPEQEAPDIFQIGREVREIYRKHFPVGGPSIKTELGRWVTGPEGWLVTHATHHKEIYKHYIGVDACAANLMRPAMYGAYHHITVCGKRNLPLDHVYDVTGSLCENNDKFAIDRPLPEIRDGDLLIIHDTGAHGFSMGYNYNGRLRSAEILYTCDHDFRLIRRAETPKDYFATLDMDPCYARLLE